MIFARHLVRLASDATCYSVVTRRFAVLTTLLIGLVLVGIAAAGQAAAPFVVYPFI